MRCRICGNECSIREKVHGCRAEGITELLHTRPYDIKKESVLLYECKVCGHIQTEYLLDDAFYKNYADGNGALQYYGDRIVFNQQIERLSKYADSTEKLIEIGCGGGHALLAAKKYFTACTGVEPSKNEAYAAEILLGGWKYNLQLF